MAEKKPESALPSSLKIITHSAATLAVIVTWPIRALFRDGTLAAAFRQGLHELGNTFGQMLPDSNTVQQEPGSIWSPTQGEIAASRNPSKSFYRMDHTIHTPGNRSASPSDIAKNDRVYDPRQSNGPQQDQGYEL